jgi:carnitine O-acetyltransferase
MRENRAFQSILDNSPAPAPPVGIMTGNNRDNWTRAYSHLSSSPTNVKTMKSIADSAFLIALDDASPSPSLSSIPGEGRSSSDGMREFSERLWKAGGKLAGGEGEGGNRWWDKILQWVVFKNGEAGFIGEHSPADGTPTARLNDFVSRRLLSDSPTKVVGIDGEEGARVGKLEFELDGEGLRMVEDGRKEFREHVGAYEVFYLRYGRYGKDGIKKMGFSPDAWYVPLFH